MQRCTVLKVPLNTYKITSPIMNVELCKKHQGSSWWRPKFPALVFIAWGFWLFQVSQERSLLELSRKNWDSAQHMLAANWRRRTETGANCHNIGKRNENMETQYSARLLVSMDRRVKKVDNESKSLGIQLAINQRNLACELLGLFCIQGYRSDLWSMEKRGPGRLNLWSKYCATLTWYVCRRNT